MTRFLAFLIAAYNSKGTLYRLIWTSVTVVAGLVAAQWADNTTTGLWVAAVVQIVTSEARKHLES